MKGMSLKAKILSIVITSVIALACSFTYIAFQMANTSITFNITEKITGDIYSFEEILKAEIGEINLIDRELVADNGLIIDENLKVLDTIAKELNGQVTIFKSEAGDYTRIATSIIEESGKRAVGTNLGESSAAYPSMKSGKDFVGNATILGEEYLASYRPLKDKKGDVIGILFLGCSIASANDQLMNTFYGFLPMIFGIGIIIIVLVVLIMLRVINGLIKSINEKVHTMDDSIVNLTGNGDEMADVGRELAASSEEQASNIEEISASIEEITSMIAQTSEGSNEISRLAKETKVSSDEGNASLKEMLINISEVKESSDEISKIIKVINDIAFQTNILALNAAVEAARAGEAGKGFSVVAEEVRNLAAKSAEAADSTSVIIDNNVMKSEKGVEIAKNVEEIFKTIGESIDKFTVISAESASANAEESKGMEQISQAVKSIEALTMSTAEKAQSSVETSHRLTEEITRLKEVSAELSATVNAK